MPSTGWSAAISAWIFSAGSDAGAGGPFSTIPGERRLVIRIMETAAVLLADASFGAETDRTEGMRRLYDEIEEPPAVGVSRMETTGVKVDLDLLKDYADGIRKEMLEKGGGRARPRGRTGTEPRVAQADRRADIREDEAGSQGQGSRSRATGPPTRGRFKNLPTARPVIDLILDYRGLRKLLSTYIEPFAGYVSPADGRVHTTFNQTLTSTGRLSSSNPNLQNIPIRSDQGGGRYAAPSCRAAPAAS